jgi:hypothetical protein
MNQRLVGATCGHVPGRFAMNAEWDRWVGALGAHMAGLSAIVADKGLAEVGGLRVE